MFKKVVPGSESRLTFVDHRETYGRHILKKEISSLQISNCIDIGCGKGTDLSIVKKYHPDSELFGVDFNLEYETQLKSLGIRPISMDLERERLPFENDSIDLVIANQVLEHTKEIFWINHEIFRCLKRDGIFILGVPNLLSLHNRILMMLGFHPTCSKLISAHVRVFSKRDVDFFYNNIGSSFCKLEQFYGAQFYPFPRILARFFSRLLPKMSVSSFYVIRKTGQYNGEFLEWPKKAYLETNYFTGRKK